MSGEDVLGARKTIERLKISKVEPKKKKFKTGRRSPTDIAVLMTARGTQWGGATENKNFETL
jgi:hypothetical protein